MFVKGRRMRSHFRLRVCELMFAFLLISTVVFSGLMPLNVYAQPTTQNKEPLWTYDTGSGPLSMSSDGNYIAVGGSKNVYLFSCNSSTPIWTYATGGSIASVSISADGSYIAAVSGDTNLYVFSKSGIQYVFPSPMSSAVISPDSNYIAASYEPERKLYLVNRTSRSIIWESTADKSFSHLTFSPDGDYIGAVVERRAVLLDRESNNSLWTYETGGYVYSISVSSNGSYLAAGGYDRKVYLLNQTGHAIWNYTTGNRVRSVSISSDGQHIVAGGDDQRVLFFNTTMNAPLRSYNTGRKVRGVMISSDGNYVAAVGEYIVCFYEWSSSSPIWTYGLPYRYPTYVAISNDGRYVATHDGSNRIYFFTGWPQPDFSLSCSPASQRISFAESPVEYTVTVTSIDGFDQAVSLSLSALPDEASYVFEPTAVTPTDTSTLKIKATSMVEDGDFTLNITGTGGGEIHYCTVTLIIRMEIRAYSWTESQVIDNMTTRVNYIYFANFTYDGEPVHYLDLYKGYMIKYGATANLTVRVPFDVVWNIPKYTRPDEEFQTSISMREVPNQAQIRVCINPLVEVIDDKGKVVIIDDKALTFHPSLDQTYNFTAIIGTWRWEKCVWELSISDRKILLAFVINCNVKLTPWITVTGNLTSPANALATTSDLAEVVSPKTGRLEWTKDGDTEKATIYVKPQATEGDTISVQLSGMTYSMTASVGVDLYYYADARVSILGTILARIGPKTKRYELSLPIATINYSAPLESPPVRIDTTSPIISSIQTSPTEPIRKEPTRVSCIVEDAKSGVSNVTLHYSTDNGATWTDVLMEPSSTNSTYSYTIPALFPFMRDIEVLYYITAKDITGNTAVNDNQGHYYSFAVPASVRIPLMGIPLAWILGVIITATVIVLAVVIYKVRRARASKSEKTQIKT